MQVHDVDSITEEILIQAPADWVADVRVGGRWRCEGRNMRGGTFTVEGEFTLVEPPRRLGYTWKPRGATAARK